MRGKVEYNGFVHHFERLPCMRHEGDVCVVSTLKANVKCIFNLFTHRSQACQVVSVHGRSVECNATVDNCLIVITTMIIYIQAIVGFDRQSNKVHVTLFTAIVLS